MAVLQEGTPVSPPQRQPQGKWNVLAVPLATSGSAVPCRAACGREAPGCADRGHGAWSDVQRPAPGCGLSSRFSWAASPTREEDSSEVSAPFVTGDWAEKVSCDEI